jgi:DNA-binding protein HU-beta
MNKKTLKDNVAETLGVSKREAGLAIDAVLQGIVDGIVEDGKVTLVGFGTFASAVRAARTARNPKTGEPIAVPEKVVPKFKPSAKLKDVVNAAGLPETDTDADTDADTDGGDE